MPTWHPPGTPAPQTASVSSRWPLAIISILCFWPLGIAACVFAAKVKPALQVGDVTTALNASNRVRLFFWISLAIFVLYFIILIANAGSSGTG
jgi:Interferon-induced transmembrane protein